MTMAVNFTQSDRVTTVIYCPPLEIREMFESGREQMAAFPEARTKANVD
jgi:hypothetical protein